MPASPAELTLLHEAACNLLKRAHDVLSELRTPLVGPFLDEWPKDPLFRTPQPAALPVTGWLEEGSLRGPIVGDRLVNCLRGLAALLEWRQTYSPHEMSGQFLDNYGWTELMGPRGMFASDRLACGFLLLGPETRYPPHHHEAEELYVPLVGEAAWQQGDGPWELRPPGSMIHHRSNEVHAMHTARQPLLALYLWRGENLVRPALLKPVGTA
jgi:mannose-6-phosphate isomerase-like protein (cupin superfamily)